MADNPVGRPTSYREEFVQKVDEYLALKQDVEDEFHKTRGDKTNSYDRLVKVNLPMIEDFATFLGCNKTSIYEWEKIYPAFSNALDKIREEQKKRLIEKSLSGDYNPMIAKLILSANYGISEKTEATITGKDGGPIDHSIQIKFV